MAARMTARGGPMLAALSILILACLGLPATARADDGHVLLVSSFSPASLWTEEMLAAIRRELEEQGRPDAVRFEFLDRFTAATAPSDGEWADFLAAKYRDTPIRVVIADGAPAIGFAAGSGRRVFGGAPLVGIIPNVAGLGDAAKAVSVGVTTGPHIDQTVALALAQWPGARTAVVVSDDSPQSRHLATVIDRALARATGGRVRAEHLFDRRLEDIEAAVAGLPRDSVVFYTHMSTDATGRQFRPAEVAARVARASAAPVYAFFDTSIGSGVVGGYVNNPRVAGRLAIRVALDLAAGRVAPPAPEETRYSTLPVVDWRQMQRWGIDERTLPPGTEVRFRQPSLLEAHFLETLLGLAFIVVLGASLAGISLLYVQRGRLTATLRDTNSRLEERVAARTIDIERALTSEQAARQRLRTFIDMATHEFKTPLATIDGTAQVLELLVDSGRQEIGGRLALIRRSVRRVVDLVETCLNDERFDDITVKRIRYSPALLLDRVAERQRGRGIGALTVETADLPAEGSADPELLGIALDALLDNARHYAERYGPIEVAARGEGASLVFEVRDRGPGVPPDQAERIFEKYVRGTSAGRLSTPLSGTGIGLHLVRTIAGLHGGAAVYEPRPGGGAVFRLTIPLEGTPLDAADSGAAP